MFKSNENKIWLVVVVAIIGCFAVGDAALAQEKTDLSIPAAVGYGKSAIARQAKTRSFGRSSKTTQRPVAQTVALAGAKKPIKRIKPNRQVRRTAKFANVEILLTDQFSLDYISALPRAPGSDLEVLDGPKRVIVQLSASEVKALLNEGAEITVLRKFILVEGSIGKATSLNSDVEVLQTCSGSYSEGSNDTDVNIPEGDWTYSPITISCAPPGAQVTCIDVHFEIIHTYVGDLYVDITDYDMTDSCVLWLYEGGSADNINKTVTGITTFNGKKVNQTWLLWAIDDYWGDTGYIDYWWIKVYYEGEDYDYYIRADSYFENTVELWFAFASDPGAVCFSASPDCGSFDPICDDPVFEDGYYWVSTKYNPCEDECSSVDHNGRSHRWFRPNQDCPPG
jgi:subtilisin-like proprotein convertase family protein